MTPVVCPSCGSTTWKRVETGSCASTDILDSVAGTATEAEDDHYDTDSDYVCFGCSRSAWTMESPTFDPQTVVDAFINAEWSW